MVSLRLYSDGDAEPGGGASESGETEDVRCGNGLEKVYHTTAVRYGYMKHVGEFSHPPGMKFTCGAKVVVQTVRGVELGEQVSLSCNGCDKHVSRAQLKEYIRNSGADSYRLDSGRILREATPADLCEDVRLRDRSREMTRAAQKHALQRLGRDRMKIVECENLLGGERSVFYFMAEGRVDFRNLVKDLSHEFQTRIQMHQVGARDEARLSADFETCGREVCCKVFLKALKPVSMRMAKLQRATLDPSKVSGRCGRLKCCLRYEHESYESLDAALPKKGEKLSTAHGFGTVIDRQVLTQLVQIALTSGEGAVTVVVEDILERRLKEFPESATRPPPPVEPRRGRPSRPPRAAAARPKPAITQDSGGSQPKSEVDQRRKPGRRGPGAGSGSRPRGPAAAPSEGAERPEADGNVAKKRRGRPRRRRRRPAEGDGGGDKAAGNS